MDPAGRDKPRKNILRDDGDIPVFEKIGHSVIEMPPGEDPHFFVDQGLLARMSQGGVPNMNDLFAMIQALRPLLNFRQGRAWDVQRIKGTSMHDFVNYATVAIGLYGAAAGIPIDDILVLEDIYAALRSDFGNVEMDRTYSSLPVTNVKNTELGYELFETGKIGP